MTEVFIDTVYWIGLANPRDSWHESAKMAKSQLGDRTLVTTDGVLSEFLAGTAKFGPEIRSEASDLVVAVMDDPEILVIRQTRELFGRGLDLYRRYEASQLSLQDCISIVVMRERGIVDVLTGDGEFRGFGFRLLMQR